jgi:uncharacterized membrane-anchored protein
MKAKPRLGFILIIIFQVLILVGWTGYNEISIASGQTVVLQTVPVDPMDLFRGEYVQLSYTISTIRDIPGASALKNGDKAYVHLEQDGDVWEAIEVSTTRHDDWDIFITGKVTRLWNNQATIEYGIESYFVPEGKGPEIERARDLKGRVAINGAGQAFIKELIVDGAPFRLR